MAASDRIEPPPHVVDFVIDDAGSVSSMGAGSAEWLARPGALDLVRQARTSSRGASARRAWWTSAAPVHVRFVPMDSPTGPVLLVTVVPPRPELVEAHELLTDVQQVVAEFAAAGATVAEIAVAIDRSPETVRTHVKEIYRRLSICTRLELQWLMRRPAISFEP